MQAFNLDMDNLGKTAREGYRALGSSPLISICIPTYNRAVELDELIISIVREVRALALPADRPQVEICISDNASSDDTTALVKRWQRNSDVPIVYCKAERNMGPDRNYLKAVELAGGTYCWLFGSDDQLAPGVLEHVLSTLKRTNHSLYLLNRLNCDRRMENPRAQYWMREILEDEYFDFRNPASRRRFFEQATSIGAFFSYLSAIIVRKQDWIAVQPDESYIGSAYVHAYVAGIVLRNSGIYYLYKPTVLNRGDNDTFLSQGLINRILIDLRGYNRLAQDIFGASMPDARTGLLVVLRRERPLMRTIFAIRARATPQSWPELRRELQNHGYPRWALAAATLAGAVFKPLLALRQNLKKCRA